MNLISAIERIPPSDLVSDELDLLLKRTQRGLVVLEQVGALTDEQEDGWALHRHPDMHSQMSTHTRILHTLTYTQTQAHT